MPKKKWILKDFEQICKISRRRRLKNDSLNGYRPSTFGSARRALLENNRGKIRFVKLLCAKNIVLLSFLIR